MKKELTRAYVSSERGCYSKEQVDALSFMKKEEFTALDIVKSEIPLKDKFWFIIKKTELTTRQKQDIAIGVAEIVLSIYESKYPNNSALREAIKAAKDYLAGFITLDVLRQKKAYAAAYTAYAADADAAAYTAYAAAYAAYAAVYAADADADAAAYTAYAAYVDADADAAVYAAYAAAYVDADADAAVYAAYAAAYVDAYVDAADADAAKSKKVNYTKLLLKFLIDFINNN